MIQSLIRRRLQTARERLILTRARLDSRLLENPVVSWLFVLSFPNGGSTALANLLRTSAATVALTANAEGQWLVQEMSRPRDRWREDYHPNYRLVRAVWLAQLREQGAAGKVVVEKSPPNMGRIRPLLETFSDMRCVVTTLTRDPYATCEGWVRRYLPEDMRRQWAPQVHTASLSRLQLFEFVGDVWGRRAETLLAAASVTDLTLSYEGLCAEPRRHLEPLFAMLPELSDVNTSAVLDVKDYSRGPLQNLNAVQIGRLSGAEVDAISRGLALHEVAVESLGYGLR